MQTTFSITVPSNIKGHEDLTAHATAVDSVLSELARVAGGATATAGRGSYLSNDGQIIIETVAIVTAAANHDITEAVRSIAARLRDEMMQECVAYSVGDQMYFI